MPSSALRARSWGSPLARYVAMRAITGAPFDGPAGGRAQGVLHRPTGSSQCGRPRREELGVCGDGRSEPQLLDERVAEPEALDLGRRHRPLVDDADVARDLERRDAAAAELD